MDIELVYNDSCLYERILNETILTCNKIWIQYVNVENNRKKKNWLSNDRFICYFIFFYIQRPLKGFRAYRMSRCGLDLVTDIMFLDYYQVHKTLEGFKSRV